MDTEFNSNVINNYLHTVALYLSEAECEVEWKENELVGFAIEWGDIIAKANLLKNAYENGEMNQKQITEFEELKNRFQKSDSAIKKLLLTNPFHVEKS